MHSFSKLVFFDDDLVEQANDHIERCPAECLGSVWWNR